MGQPSPEAVQNLTRDLLSRSTSRPDASAAAGDAGYAWLLSSRRGSRAALRSQPPPFGRSPGAWRCLRLHPHSGLCVEGRQEAFKLLPSLHDGPWSWVELAGSFPSRAPLLTPPHPPHTCLCHLLTCQVTLGAHSLSLAGKGRKEQWPRCCHSLFHRGQARVVSAVDAGRVQCGCALGACGFPSFPLAQ